jgi:hypothetical protein
MLWAKVWPRGRQWWGDKGSTAGRTSAASPGRGESRVVDSYSSGDELALEIGTVSRPKMGEGWELLVKVGRYLVGTGHG